jgi:hypothetical protein
MICCIVVVSGSQPVVRVPLGVRGGQVLVGENCIGNGGKRQKKKKGVKIKTQKQSYEVSIYKERHVKVVTRPAHR